MNGGRTRERDREDRPEDLDEDRVDDQGSVGDWRLPHWMPRIAGLAWLFIALGVLSLVAQLVTFMPGIGWGFPSRSDVALAAITRGLPIFIPAAALWRTGRPRSRPLLFGSLALGISAFFGSIVSLPGSEVTPVPGATVWDALAIPGIALTVAILCTVGGPLLLGNAVRGEPGGASRRGAIRWGVAIGGLTIAYLGLSVAYPVEVFHRYVTDPSSRGGIDFYGMSGSILKVGAWALVGWGYFAWAVASAGAGDGQRRASWLLARAAVLIQQVSVALMTVVIAIWYFAAQSSRSVPFADAVEWASGVVFFVTPILLGGTSVLLIAAFAAGLGSSRAIEPSPKRVEPRPIPILG